MSGVNIHENYEIDNNGHIMLKLPYFLSLVLCNKTDRYISLFTQQMHLFCFEVSWRKLIYKIDICGCLIKNSTEIANYLCIQQKKV